MQEEADAHVGPAGAQQLRNEQQVVVVHPHSGALGGDARDHDGESLVDAAVGAPPGAVHLLPAQPAVEQGPQHRVGEPAVVPGLVACRESQRVQLRASDHQVVDHRRVGAGPAHPARTVGGDRRERRCQPARTGGDGAVGPDLDGKSIGRDDQRSHSAPAVQITDHIVPLIVRSAGRSLTVGITDGGMPSSRTHRPMGSAHLEH